jgi:hypothetical protein
MSPEKEVILVHAVVQRSAQTIFVVAEAEAQLTFAKTLGIEVVQAVRVRNVEVHPEVVADFVATRVNRFVDATARAVVIEQGIDVGIVAAVQELDALTTLGLSSAGARPDQAPSLAAPSDKKPRANKSAQKAPQVVRSEPKG